ncbi:MAG: T9SS type A sorting domain-containing protein, partial [Bacteroidales bacterium]|nr:T9SS type A sorting domain-containing protein [Bacteroidales bacterium]
NGETYSQFGFNENTAGFYTQSLQTIKGCDSIVNLNLIINPIYNDTILAEICSNETYTLNGFNVNTAGFYTQSLQTIKGCDSIVNLSLIVNPIYNDTIIAEICQGEVYSQFGFNESNAGFYTQNLQTIKGCDSVVNLSLIVNPIYNDTIIAEICQGEVYSQFGFIVSTAGFYTQSLQTIKGCDSIVNLSLIVNPIYNDTIIAEICQGEIYTLNGFNVSTAGLHTQNLQTNKGCDSIVNLGLVINSTSLTTYYDTICQGNLYTDYGFSFIADTTGRYTQNLQTINGCDSIIALNLTVKPTPIVPEGFIVQVRTNFIELNWQDNGSSYVIYRNNDSITTTTMPIYLDYDVINEQPYCYKVKSINGDCESEFSNIVCKTFLGMESVNPTNISTKLYPNPTEGKAKLEVEGLNSDADVLVYDMIGRVIQTHKINKGKKELEIDLSGYAKGVYSIRIMNDNINQTKKLIVQ